VFQVGAAADIYRLGQIGTVPNIEGAEQGVIAQIQFFQIGVGIICTAATAKSSCFECEITKINSKIQTKALPLGELVTLVEDGASDTSHTVRDAVKIKKMLEPIKDFNPDVLILGCTHFSRVGKIISQALPTVKLIDSAKTGAREILARHGHGGTGKMIYV